MLGADGHTLWIALQYSSKLGSYDLRTGAFREFDTPLAPQVSAVAQPGPKIIDLANGPDGHSVWFTTFSANRVFRFDTNTSKLSEPACGIPPGGSTLGITVGPDRKIWYSSPTSARIFRVNNS
jgi:streptogramin lyase